MIDPTTAAGVLRHQADRRGEQTFLVAGDRSWSYREARDDAAALAVALSGLGVEAGDRIAVDLPNWPESVIVTLAAAELGAVVVPLNPGYTSRELQFMLRNSEATVAVTPEQHGETDYLQLFESLLVELPALQYLVTVGEEDLWYDDRIFQFEDLLSSGRGRSWTPAETAPEEEFGILYTPGTTGKPKGVVLTHANLVRTARRTAEALSLEPDDRTLCSVPLFHIFGFGAALFTVLCSGSTLLLQERFEASEALELMERHRVTVFHGVPTMFVMALREEGLEERDLSPLRTGIVAGAPVDERLIRRARREMAEGLEIAYGLTETSPTVSMTRPSDDEERRSTTVGRPLEGVEVRILDEEGEAVPRGESGEIGVRGYNVMQGYFRQPGETASSFTDDGFFRTGDLAIRDEDGYLRVVGRKSDVILRGGYNVHPREVEDHLRSHPAVLDAVVVGVPHDVMGELVCACVHAVEGAIVSEDELREYCESALADYKVPDLVRFYDELPRTPDGKASRRELARSVREEETPPPAERD